ncbi:ATP-binding protein [Paenibacillus polymyxa]|uniref:ATP-binding protein n=1 Tax=Paenibacillus polymyxa TaxID=1406 RepID=UPI0008C1E6A3|nr:ATP-binding protein [Paenibacillus polymyxa]SEJ39674.1 AAA domain-containing protein, putative AbiEii toxin, Type IV TA system [Paenibacillus polymyxa]
MQPDWLKSILDRINHFIGFVPKGRTALENTHFMDLEQLLTALNELFRLEEEAIVVEKLHRYVTDNYENNVRLFARKLIKEIVPIHSELKECSNYKKLLGQKHIAYGFYCQLDSGLEHCHILIKDTEFEEPLYLGLVAFYQSFYGSFYDNEEAIKLLCKYYPKEDYLYENKGDIVSAIFRHITNAGTPSDFGFAYKGIQLIQEHIGNLPLEIIDKLLQSYQLYRIINEKVYRHQIFSIIDHSRMTYDAKRKYKFSYLDSLLLVNNLNRSLPTKYKQNESDYSIWHYMKLEVDLSVDKFELLKDTTDNLYAYWTNSYPEERRFTLNGEVIITISLSADQQQITIRNIKKPVIPVIKAEFKYDDWFLDGYKSLEIEQKLQNFVLGESEVDYHPLTFSLLYLNDYRGVSQQMVDFDHRFTYDMVRNELALSTISPVIPHFYGNKVHSLSCIVGKNGTGKTSTVDFLRGTFFRLIHLIGEYGVPCVKGYVNEADYEAYGILDKGCEFIVAFYLGDQPYYLTNIERVTNTVAEPFDLSAYKNVNQLSKVIYFSNMISVNQDNLYIDEDLSSRDESKEDKVAVAKSLSSFRQADYSESSSFIQKRKTIEASKQKESSLPVVNKDLCYQLAFIGYLTVGNIGTYFDMPAEQVFTLNSVSLGIENVLLTVADSLEDIMGKVQKPFLMAPDAKLEYFSSGQYAKFTFLAKLYWFLEGYQKHIDDFEEIIGTNVFSRDEALLKEETALIFIDEGELYYHPEWQRNYIKTLVDTIRDTVTKSKLQVVITTNSPFIISDILSEDITYLSRDNKSFDRTFGQNIHKLLKDNFFMSYTIGEYSREAIENILGWLHKDSKKENVGKGLGRYFGEPVEHTDYHDKIRCIIDKIGEPVYREKLLDMLYKSKWGKDYRIEELLRQKVELERTIKELQEG